MCRPVLGGSPKTRRLQGKEREGCAGEERTALVTARSALAHERAVRTLMEWNIEPDFYFDDQRGHVDSARAYVAAGHVPFGVANLR